MTTKEKPILFTGPNVRGILEDRKTQTRRIVKDPKMPTVHPGGGSKLAVPDWYLEDCPYGQPGDLLWVKETHSFWCHSVESVGVEYAAGGEDEIVDFTNGVGMPSLEVLTRKNIGGGRRKRPSIFMPRWASRLTLEITAVRVERLQGISEEDAIAEGCCGVTGTQWGVPNYRYVWESINGPGSWALNPYVWCITFKRL